MSELFGKELYGKVCEHGSLARSCGMCELIQTLAAERDAFGKRETELESALQKLMDRFEKRSEEIHGLYLENNRMKKGLKDILAHCKIVMPHGYNLMGVYRIAEEALAGELK